MGRKMHGAKNPAYKHGLSGHRIYIIWSNMKQRCNNPKAHEYAAYGGRGITVCDEWLHDVKVFYDWAMANGYRDDLTIDRIDNDKGYSPDNCRWATKEQQYSNMRNRSGENTEMIVLRREIRINRSTFRRTFYDIMNGFWDGNVDKFIQKTLTPMLIRNELLRKRLAQALEDSENP